MQCANDIVKRSRPSGVPIQDFDAIVAWAESNPLIRKVMLFGSRARGTYRMDSDTDLAYECDVKPGDTDETTTAICENRNWLAQLQSHCSLKVDLQHYDKVGTPTVEKGIKAGSVLIWERAA